MSDPEVIWSEAGVRVVQARGGLVVEAERRDAMGAYAWNYVDNEATQISALVHCVVALHGRAKPIVPPSPTSTTAEPSTRAETLCIGCHDVFNITQKRCARCEDALRPEPAQPALGALEQLGAALGYGGKEMSGRTWDSLLADVRDLVKNPPTAAAPVAPRPSQVQHIEDQLTAFGDRLDALSRDLAGHTHYSKIDPQVLNTLEARLDAIETSIEAGRAPLTRWQREVDAALRALAETHELWKSTVDTLSERATELHKRLEGVEVWQAARVPGLLGEGFAKLHERIARLEAGTQSERLHLSALAARVVQFETATQDRVTKLEAIAVRVDALEAENHARCLDVGEARGLSNRLDALAAQLGDVARAAFDSPTKAQAKTLSERLDTLEAWQRAASEQLGDAEVDDAPDSGPFDALEDCESDSEDGR